MHLDVERDFCPACKAHPAFVGRDLRRLAARLRVAGFEVAADEPLDGLDRLYASNPFGNHIEFMEPMQGPTGAT